MSPTDARRTTFADPAEIDAFVDMLGRFERREIDAEQWRAYRVVRGAYSQRQDGTHMLRIKIPQGILDAAQLRALAEVATRWSRGFGHVTTRQNLQLHFVRPSDLEPAMRRLADAGITTSGAGGNAVRNVVACPLAGVAADEAFDVTPYAEAVTRWFLRHPLANALPRKLKIAFEGCVHDHVATAIQDLGFRAKVRTVQPPSPTLREPTHASPSPPRSGGEDRGEGDQDGEVMRGFSVTVAGGTSSLCTSGSLLLDFLPAADVLALAEAVVRVFHSRGDRVNKQRNRLKFLVRDLGLDAFRALVEAELASVRREGAPRLPFDPGRPPEERAPAHAGPRPAAIRPRHDLPPSERDAFIATNVRAQRQPGFATVTVAFPQGEVTAAQLEALADLTLACGDGSVRLSPDGHALLRWVRVTDLPSLHEGLAAAGLARTGARTAADVVACPGAEVCRQAVTRTRDVARLVEARLREGAVRDALAEPFPVRVSGCPNGCSRHHVAAIGLQGSARKLGNRAVPQYFVLVGGGVRDEGAAFGKLAGKVPARRVPEAVERLLALYLAERRRGEDAARFFGRALERARAAIASLEELGLQDARAEDFVEPGAADEFRPDVQAGECAA